MSLNTVWLALSFGACVAWANVSNTDGLLSRVDPLIGTTNGGHVFAGATLPFAMAKAVADVNVENQGGFSSFPENITECLGCLSSPPYTGNITGFSHMHDSGTGGVSTDSQQTQKTCRSDDITALDIHERVKHIKFAR